MKKSILTFLLISSFLGGFGQSKLEFKGVLTTDSIHKYADTLNTSSQIRIPGSFTINRTFNFPKPVITIDHPQSDSTYTIHFKRSNLKWINDSTAVYKPYPELILGDGGKDNMVGGGGKLKIEQ